MKPPIPNIIAHSEEKGVSLVLPIVIVLVIVSISMYLYYRKTKNDKVS